MSVWLVHNTTHWSYDSLVKIPIGYTSYWTYTMELIAVRSIGPTTHWSKYQIVGRFIVPTYHSQCAVQPIDPTSHLPYSDYHWSYILEPRNCVAHSQYYCTCSLWNNKRLFSYQLLLKKQKKHQKHSWDVIELGESARNCMASGLPW